MARRAALLAGGDAAALLLFAAIGRSSHGEGLAPGGVLSTAAPFLLGAARWAPGYLSMLRESFMSAIRVLRVWQCMAYQAHSRQLFEDCDNGIADRPSISVCEIKPCLYLTHDLVAAWHALAGPLVLRGPGRQQLYLVWWDMMTRYDA